MTEQGCCHTLIAFPIDDNAKKWVILPLHKLLYVVDDSGHINNVIIPPEISAPMMGNGIELNNLPKGIPYLTSCNFISIRSAIKNYTQKQTGV